MRIVGQKNALNSSLTHLYYMRGEKYEGRKTMIAADSEHPCDLRGTFRMIRGYAVGVPASLRIGRRRHEDIAFRGWRNLAGFGREYRHPPRCHTVQNDQVGV